MRKIRIFWWSIFNKERYNMYLFGMRQEFSESSSYYSAKCANIELVKFINKSII